MKRSLKEANIYEVVWVKYRTDISFYLDQQIKYYTAIQYYNLV